MANEGRCETFGIGEWYGIPLSELTVEQRQHFARIQTMKASERPDMVCPFQTRRGHATRCTKKGGVCSLRRYADTPEGTAPVPSADMGICATCPSRFEQDGLIYRWIGEEILGSPAPVVLSQVGFLLDPRGKYVGRIDGILVHPDMSKQLEWCALETQAVYFSGLAMANEFSMLCESTDPLPYPAARRHPDFRSSGPKRLMPQLQTKVPTLRRWGKKMAVVVDEPFFRAIGEMETVDHVSNGDIVWFVVGYEEGESCVKLTKSTLAVTTLEESVIGLTGGAPVSKAEFEAEILRKLPR